MIKVCHVTSAHPKEDVRIFQKECISLARAGYDVYLVQQGECYEKNGVHIVGFGSIATNRIKRMLSTSKTAYKTALGVDADVYHLHDPELLSCALKLKRKGKKVVFDSHEHTAEAIFEKEWLPAFVRKLVFNLYSAYQTRICKKLDGIISVTPNIVDYFKAINPQTVQVANVPILSEQEELTVEKQCRVAFAGGISRQWNHHTLLRALEQVPQCRYVLCGIADSNYLSELQSMPGWSQVDYLGKIPHKQVSGHLSASLAGIALLQPGRNTDWDKGTIGNTKIFEEMMAGLPVICTNFSLWREFVERYHCGICVTPDNPEEIAKALTYLLDNPEEARKMGENGRQAIKEEFNWRVEEKKLFALYENITGGTV